MIRFWVFVAIAACAAQVAIAADKFSCEGRASGYYADVDTGCQVYHMCDGLGRQFSYSCPNTTLFQQRMLICDHWYMVNCSKSELDYNANLLIGQRDKPFVEDSSEHPYHRTPRPDLLQQPYAPRYQDSDYRQGRVHSLPSNLNLVGVATDEEDENGNPIRNYTTDRPQYFLPSHWSTQYGKGLTTPIPPKVITKINKQNYNTGGKSSTGDRKLPPPNFNYDPKHYKAPTEQKIPPKNNSASKVLPALPRSSISPVPTKNPISSTFPQSIPNNPSPFVPPPSKSPFVQTQPISHSQVPLQPRLPTLQNNQINKSPTINRGDSLNIPDTVNEASVSPSSLALPPFTSQVDRSDERSKQTNSFENIPKPSIFYQPPKFSSSYESGIESSTMDPKTFYNLVPSKVLLPPAPQQTTEDRSPIVRSTSPRPTTTPKVLNKKDTEQNKQTNTENRWKELRQMFFIPEYDFPLEVASRPSYEGGLSSFQVKIGPPNPESRSRSNSRTSPESGGPNPNCPKCDPAFLAPGTCKPCIMIRR